MVAAVRRAAERGHTVRPVGSGWSDSALVLTGDVHLDCSALTGIVAVGAETVRVRAGASITSVQAALAAHGRMLPLVTHAPAATVAGAVATGTHGGSTQWGSLSALVTGSRLVDGGGRLRTADDSELDGLRVGLGVLGVLTEVTLRTVPAVEGEIREEIAHAHPEVLAPGGPLDTSPWTSFELHLPSGEGLLRRVGPPLDREPEPVGGGPVEALGRVATRIGHAASTQWSAQRSRPVPRFDEATTGLPYDLLRDPHPARAEFTEWAVPREALDTALRELGAATAAQDVEIKRPIEVRTGPAETGWLHPAHGRPTAWIAVRASRGETQGRLFRLVGSVLEGMGGRPHWGGRHDWTAADVALAYPRLTDFLALRERIDPDRRFTGDHLDALLGNATS
ncbi:D-arabinono-1,4-lactone oxidase [Pseudonocardia ailaonensis]|uniref:D-arabinono-1,4-lactone oxidase n=1 Tax=Pseudonocardia ailaonensis TaxID=367279 RepID=A0ABN2NAJ5_9PSEU